MHPLVDPKKITDDELYERITKLRKYHMLESSDGHFSMSNSIAMLLASLEEEHEYRQGVKKHELEMHHAEQLKKRTTNKIKDTYPINIGTIDTEKNDEC